MKNKRSTRIIMTNEGRVLKQLRNDHELSMRKAGELIGRSDTYIAHIENGRMDPPKGEKLDKLLAIYGGIKQKTFYERVRNYRDKITPRDELIELIRHMGDEKISVVLNIAKNL